MEFNKSEMLRYWGCRGTDDPSLLAVADKAGKAALEICRPRYVSRVLDCKISGEHITLGDVEIHSRALARCLNNCDRAIMFASTLGMELDGEIRRYSKINMAYSTALSAAGSAIIESYCDECCEKFRVEFGDISPRFSPGYGDLSLEHQHDFFNKLDITRRIGITLTDSLLMIPSKSVTAIIGIRNKEDV